MRNRSFLTFLLLALPIANLALAADDLPSKPPADGGALIDVQRPVFDTKTQKREENNTYQIMDAQTRRSNSGTANVFSLQNDLAIGQGRAQEMANLLKDAQLKQAFEKVTKNQKQILYENPGLKNPAAVIGGAVALWVGKTIRLLRSEALNVSSKIEARSRSGEFMMESPLMNGRLHYDANDGATVSVNRSISSINSNAEFRFNAKYQTMSTEIQHRLSPNINFSIGSSQIPLLNQTDEHATIQYQLNF